MDLATLRRAMGRDDSDERYAALLPAMNRAMIAAGCENNLARSAMWCAQLGHESIGLTVFRELWGPTDDQRNYDPSSGSATSRQLGNTQPGDGFRYRGRGPIQITGRGNHAKASKWAHDHGLAPTPTYFVDHPEALESDQYGFVGAVWYWVAARDMNGFADRGDIVGATRAINGGTNGLTDRTNRWNRCRAIGAALLPTPNEGLDMADISKDDAAALVRGGRQFDGGAGSDSRAPQAWLLKYLPKSFKDKAGPWVRDQITALVNELVTGSYDLTSPIDFGDGRGPIAPKDIPPTQPVNFVTLVRVIGARQAVAQGLIKP